MKLFYLFLASFFISLSTLAQPGWKVMLNGKTVLNTTVEDETKNIVRIKKADLKKKKGVSVIYTEEAKKKNWEREIALYDENDRELARQKGTELKISNSVLQSFFKKSKKVGIYTLAFPADPKLKAAIRIRRVHLCTLILE
ncbi:MAG TPA: hypothetical protein VEV15_12920 [Flavisolibacter sp.]|nr:hypothetical protein [Flavisolibacter sp.]